MIEIKNLFLVDFGYFVFKIGNKYVPKPKKTPLNILNLSAFKIDENGSKLIVFLLRSSENKVEIIIYQQDSSDKIYSVYPEFLSDGVTSDNTQYFVTNFYILNVPNMKLKDLSQKKINIYNQLKLEYSKKKIDSTFFNNISNTIIPLTDNPNINKIILDSLTTADIIELYSINFYIRIFINQYIIQQIKEEYYIDLTKYNKINIFDFYIKILFHGITTELMNYITGKGYLDLLFDLMFSSNLNYYQSEYTIYRLTKSIDNLLEIASSDKRHILQKIIDDNTTSLSFNSIRLGLIPDVDGANLAIKNRQFPTVKFLTYFDIYPDSDGADYAAENNDIEILKFLQTFNIQPTSRGCDKAAIKGNIRALKWIYKIYKILPTIHGANETESIKVLNWMERNFILPNDNPGGYNAVKNKQYDVLEWMFQRDIIPTSIAMTDPLRYRDIDMIEWLLNHDIKLDQHTIQDYTYSLSQDNKIIDMNDLSQKNLNKLEKDIKIITMLSNKFLLPSLYFPIKYDLNHIINEQIKKDYKITVKDANDAASVGKLYILQWIYNNHKILPDENGINLAARNNHYNVLEWLKDQGLYPDAYSLREAAKKGYLEVVKLFDILEIKSIYYDEELVNLYNIYLLNNIRINSTLDIDKELTTLYQELTSIKKHNLPKLKDFLREMRIIRNSDADFDQNILDEAVGQNNMEFIKHYENKGIYPSSRGADNAATNGHLDMIIYLEKSSFNRIEQMKNKLNDELNQEYQKGMNKIERKRQSILQKKEDFDWEKLERKKKSLGERLKLKYDTIMEELYEKHFIFPGIVGANGAAEKEHLNVLKYLETRNLSDNLRIEQEITSVYPNNSHLNFSKILKHNNFEMLTYLANIPTVDINKIKYKPITPSNYYISEYIKNLSVSNEDVSNMIKFLVTIMKPKDIFKEEVFDELSYRGLIDIFKFADSLNILPDARSIANITHTYEYNSNSNISLYIKTYFNIKSVLNWLIFGQQHNTYKVLIDDSRLFRRGISHFDNININFINFNVTSINNLIESGDVVFTKIAMDTIVETYTENDVRYSTIRNLEMIKFLEYQYGERGNMYDIDSINHSINYDRMNIFRYIIPKSSRYNDFEILEKLIKNERIADLEWFLNFLIFEKQISVKIFDCIDICMQNSLVNCLRVINKFHNVFNLNTLKTALKNFSYDILRWFMDFDNFSDVVKEISPYSVDDSIMRMYNINDFKFILHMGLTFSNNGMDKAAEHGKLFILNEVYRNYPDQFKIYEAANLAAMNDQLNVLKWLESLGVDKLSSYLVHPETVKKLLFTDNWRMLEYLLKKDYIKQWFIDHKSIRKYPSEDKYLPGRRSSSPGGYFPDERSSLGSRIQQRILSSQTSSYGRSDIDLEYRQYPLNLTQDEYRMLLNDNYKSNIIILFNNKLFNPNQADVNYLAMNDNIGILKFIYEQFNLLPSLEFISKINDERILDWLSKLEELSLEYRNEVDKQTKILNKKYKYRRDRYDDYDDYDYY